MFPVPLLSLTSVGSLVCVRSNVSGCSRRRPWHCAVCSVTPLPRYFTWRSVVLVSQSDFDYPRVTRYACQARGRTVPLGGLWGTQAAWSRIMNGTRAFSTLLSNFQKSLHRKASVCCSRAIIGIHVLVGQPYTTEHGVLEMFRCRNWARCDAF